MKRVAAGVATVLLLAACSGAVGARDSNAPQRSCGPVSADQVDGRTPVYAADELDGFTNDEAMCGGLWVPGADRWLVPQGLAIDAGTAWVTGYDGSEPVGHRACILEQVDLGSGELIQTRRRLVGAVPGRAATFCRHGGGVLVDEDHVWIAEFARLWLLDRDDLSVERVWSLGAPVKGSYALWGPGGALGIGRYEPHKRGRVYWFDPDVLLASDAAELVSSPGLGNAGALAAQRSQRAPRAAQGATWGRLGSLPAQIWFASSTTTCGILQGSRGQRRAFIPGAEGLDFGAGRLWVLSESSARSYQALGGRPWVPMLAGFSPGGLARGAGPDCST